MRNRIGHQWPAEPRAPSPHDGATALRREAAGHATAEAAALSTTRRFGHAAWRTLLLATACASLTACSLMTWAVGDRRSDAPAGPPVTPASPLGTDPSASPSPSSAPASPSPGTPGEARAEAGAGGATPAAASTADPRPATSTPSEPARPGGATATSPVPAPPTAGAAPTPGPAPGAPPPSSGRSSGSAAPGAAAAAPRPPEPAAAGGRYVVQVGAFRSAAAAESVREQLAAELLRVPELARLTGSLRVAEQGGLHRVWLGSASSLAAARALAARIRAATGREAFVARP